MFTHLRATWQDDHLEISLPELMRLFSKPAWPDLALILTMALFGVASSLPLDSMWGINHLQFLPSIWWDLYWLAFAAVIVIAFVRAFDVHLDRVVEGVSRSIFDHGVRPKLAIAAVAMLIFWLFRMQTHFLGDGYTILSIYSRDVAPTPRWTEVGSMMLVRAIQSLFGQQPQQAILHALQILSIAGGGVVVYNSLEIVQALYVDARVRLLGLATLLFSGMMLLYFGYIEYYFLLWAAGTTFFHLALKFFASKRWFWLSLVAAVGATFLHLQAAYLVAGVIYLVVFRLTTVDRRFRWSSIHWVAVGIVVASSTAVILWLYLTRVAFEVIFLPPFVGRPPASEYAAFSPKHLLDMLNLALLLLPGLCVLGILAFTRKKGASVTPSATFLTLCLSGSFLFLLVVNPVLGMERDWDLMSFTIFPFMLLMLLRLQGTIVTATGRLVLAYSVVGLLMTSTYLAANVGVESSETRYHSLLRYYGAKDRSGWAIFVNYYHDQGFKTKAAQIRAEMDSVFPGYQYLQKVYALIASGQYEAACALSDSLVRTNTYNPDYLQVYGNCLGKVGRVNESIASFQRAMNLRPHSAIIGNELGKMYLDCGRLHEALSTFRGAHQDDPQLSFVMEGLGLTFLRLKMLDSAFAVADSLMDVDPHSPGGHLLRMMIAIQRGDMPAARAEFAEYRQYGVKRSDYQRILSYYSYLDK